MSPVWRGLTALALAAALVLALLASKYSAALQDEEIRDSARRAALSDRITDLERDVVAARNQVAALHEQAETGGRLASVELSPDSRIIRLAPLLSDPGANGLIAVSAAGRQAVIYVTGLPPAAAGKIYELWWIEGRGKAAKAALFRPDANGGAIVVVASPSPDQRLVAIIVTLEPASGSDKPTGATYLKSAAGNR